MKKLPNENKIIVVIGFCILLWLVIFVTLLPDIPDPEEIYFGIVILTTAITMGVGAIIGGSWIRIDEN